MYIVTFVQSDSNNIDSNLCSTPQEVLSKVKEFFEDSLLDGFPEWEIYLKDELGSKREDMSIGVGCYTTIHIQKLNAYSHEQLSLVNQQTQLTTSDSYVVSFTIDGGDSLDSFVVQGNIQDFIKKTCNEIDSQNESTNYTDAFNESNVNFKNNSLDTQKIWVDGEYIYIQKSRVVINQQTPLAPQEPLKPFVVAATLPDYSQVVLGRFDNEADQKMFEMNCSLYSYEECKCGVCGKALGDYDEIYTDHYSSALLCDKHSRFNEETDMYEATEGDLERRPRVVKVVLDDDDSFTISITGTKKEITNCFPIGRIVTDSIEDNNKVAIKELIFIEDEANRRYAKLQEDRQRAAQRIFEEAEEAERKEFEEWHEQIRKESTFRFPKI